MRVRRRGGYGASSAAAITGAVPRCAAVLGDNAGCFDIGDVLKPFAWVDQIFAWEGYGLRPLSFHVENDRAPVSYRLAAELKPPLVVVAATDFSTAAPDDDVIAAPLVP